MYAKAYMYWMYIKVLSEGNKMNIHWNEDKRLDELTKAIKDIGHFPTYRELQLNNYGRLALNIIRNGGLFKYAKILGYDISDRHHINFIHKPKSFHIEYSSEDKILSTLKKIEMVIGHFPTDRELRKSKEYSFLLNKIYKTGGINKYRILSGNDYVRKPIGYYTDEIFKKELNEIIEYEGYFPSTYKLIKLGHKVLVDYMCNNGGVNKYRIDMGYNLISHKLEEYTFDDVLKELKEIIKEIDHFPTSDEIIQTKGRYLLYLLNQNGGLYHFSTLLGYKSRKPQNFWSNYEDSLKEIQMYVTKKGFFPTSREMINSGDGDILAAISKHGGFIHIKRKLGYDIDYISEMTSYVNIRGKNTENIVFDILVDYCNQNNLLIPKKEVKFSSGKHIEFVCEVNKTVGIDVTNTRTKDTVIKKWTKRDYHKYLDEVWIVVFSDSFNENDYIKWNGESPDNVYIMSIEEFCNELKYSMNNLEKNKIDKYKSCTFHTRDQYKKEKQEVETVSTS